MKLKELASMLGGELRGNPDVEIAGAAGIQDAKEGEITFLSDRKLLKECAGSKASAVISGAFYDTIGKPQIIVKNPRYSFAKVLEHFYLKPNQPLGISSGAFVSKSAKIGSDVSVYPFACISGNAEIGNKTVIYPGAFIGEGSVIGAECIIYPNVTIREGVTIGDRVVIHSGTVVGSDGFGYIMENNRHYKIPQVGGVIIEDDVELGGNVVIERATTGNTLIGSGTKICDLVTVGHNTKIGSNVILVGLVGIGGSVKIGDYVVIGGQAGISDHAQIDDGCMIGGRAGVVGHLSKGVYSGVPAINHRDWLKSASLFARLPEFAKKIKELEDKLDALERRRQQ